MKTNNHYWLLGLILLLLLNGCTPPASSDYPVQPVPFTEVRIQDDFWLPRIETNRTVTIPFALQMNEETGRVKNFAIAAGLEEGKYFGRRFNDTDVYKVIEGAAYSLRVHPDPELESRLDGLIELIAAAQEEDGYLYAARTADPANPRPGAGPERWSRLRGSHELYNAGHLYEAAVAYYLATGKRKLLDVSLKNAELLLQVFGPDKRRDIAGHQEIEIGLAKLYRVTGKKDYLELAKFFLDQRGGEHASGHYPEDTPFALYNQRAYMQDHKPVTEQAEAVGHAVRASYMYSGMADVAALGGYPEYIQAIDRLWENVVGKKLYLTGGIGARHTSEAFGDNYELPNESAYTETCAAIGNIFWNHRMFLLHGDAKYLDVLERVLYNGSISGVSLEGNRFFYQNPLASAGKYERSPWFEVSCCPGNLTRFLPSVPGYIYAQKEKILYINLFVQSVVEMELAGSHLRVEQKTCYPWEGKVETTITPEDPGEFTLNIRIPGWAQNRPVPSDLYRYLREIPDKPRIEINGEAVKHELDKGFAVLHRRWEAGDRITLDLPMPVRRVLAHEKVAADQGRVALERGPLVYCVEWPDNPGGVFDLTVSDETEFQVEERPELLGRIVIIRGEKFAAIPYYAWAHRGPGEMAVWLKRK
jgi:DUF1680 family protein